MNSTLTNPSKNGHVKKPQWITILPKPVTTTTTQETQLNFNFKPTLPNSNSNLNHNSLAPIEVQPTAINFQPTPPVTINPPPVKLNLTLSPSSLPSDTTKRRQRPWEVQPPPITFQPLLIRPSPVSSQTTPFHPLQPNVLQYEDTTAVLQSPPVTLKSKTLTVTPLPIKLPPPQPSHPTTTLPVPTGPPHPPPPGEGGTTPAAPQVDQTTNGFRKILPKPLAPVQIDRQ